MRLRPFFLLDGARYPCSLARRPPTPPIRSEQERLAVDVAPVEPSGLTRLVSLHSLARLEPCGSHGSHDTAPTLGARVP